MSETYITKDMIEQARSADLASYFQRGGYDCELRKNELHVKGYGGFFINTETNQWYCFSMSGKNGGRNAINCLTQIVGLDFKTAVSELIGSSFSRSTYRDVPTPEPPKKRELLLPERADNMRNVYAYLCQTRKIDSNIVSGLVRDGLLYQDKRGNAVFVHKNERGEIVGAELQGTNSYKRFKGVAAGTADSVFTEKNGTPNRAYVFESAIDLLSFKQLAKPEKIQNCAMVSMAGLKPHSLRAFEDKGLRMYACVDNDEAGIKFTADNGLIPCNRILRENNVKDFNELLQVITRNREAQSQTAPTQNSGFSQEQSQSIPKPARKKR